MRVPSGSRPAARRRSMVADTRSAASQRSSPRRRRNTSVASVSMSQRTSACVAISSNWAGIPRDTYRSTMLALVDDDVSVLESVRSLLASYGYQVATYPSALDFLRAGVREGLSCIILDVQMPGMTGPELQARLNAAGSEVPIVFITSVHDDALRARVIGAGAVAFLYKPFDEDALIDALGAASATASI